MKQYKVLGVCNGQGIGLFPFKGDKRFKILGNLEVRGVYFTPKNEQWIDITDIEVEDIPVEKGERRFDVTY